jgi:hypothetical protein
MALVVAVAVLVKQVKAMLLHLPMVVTVLAPQLLARLLTVLVVAVVALASVEASPLEV